MYFPPLYYDFSPLAGTGGSAPVVATQDDDKPKKRRAKLTVYKKPPEPKKRLKVKLKKKPVIEPVSNVRWEVVEEVPALTQFAESRKASPPIEGELDATLEGCTTAGMSFHLTNNGTLRGFLDGIDMSARGTLSYEDDAVALYMKLPLEPEVIEI